jgi:hypothetical protein
MSSKHIFDTAKTSQLSWGTFTKEKKGVMPGDISTQGWVQIPFPSPVAFAATTVL